VGELVPLFRGPNTGLNTPLALAIVSAIAVESWGIASLGLRAYGRKFFNFGGAFRGLFRFNFGQFFKGAIDAFVGILELISEGVRLISFTFRLFGNMFAGEVVILMFTFLTPVILTVAFYGLELFVGIIQAFIFAMLTLVFGIMAVTHSEHAAEKDEQSRAAAEHLQESEA
jgi:F-type H+-transporting ATPase subunit a